jgi:hypothetical protein
VVRPRAKLIAQDALFSEMLFAVCWTAFHLGAVGNRARRGYGGLSISAVSWEPSGRGPEWGSEWPAFEDPPEDWFELARKMRKGVDRALATSCCWLISNGFAPRSTLPRGNARLPFFHLGSPADIYVAPAKNSVAEAIASIMSKCSKQKRSNAALFAQQLGGGDHPRSSPLWVRLHVVQDKRGKRAWVPLATYAQMNAARNVVDGVLAPAGFQAAAGGWRTLENFPPTPGGAP